MSSIIFQLVTPGFLAIMMHRQYGDEGEEGQADVDDEEEKELPAFKEGDLYGLFFSASKKVCACISYFVSLIQSLQNTNHGMPLGSQSDKVSVMLASGKFCTLGELKIAYNTALPSITSVLIGKVFLLIRCQRENDYSSNLLDRV